MNKESNYFFYVYFPIIDWNNLIENLIKKYNIFI